MKKTIIITGASSGIGKSCAEFLAKQGHSLILCARRRERLQILAESLQKINPSIKYLELDVSNREAVEKSLSQLNIQSIDVLINNAGLSLGKDDFENASLDDFEKMIHTNVLGIAYVTKVLFPYLVKSKQAHIINIGSIAGINPYQGGNMYCASKAAVKSLSESMRIDFLKYHIKVTNIQPGAIETEFSMVRFKNDEEKAKKVYEGFQPLVANDIADVVQYCIQLPQHVCLNEITITPTQQANAYYLHKNISL